MEDEHLEELFRNEEFINELRHNQDFLIALHSGLLLYNFVLITNKINI